jgi:hypothetical protein
MKKWSAFIDKYMPGANRSDGNLVYGYGVAQTLVETLRKCGDDLTRENVMKQAASLKDFTPDTLLPGVKINTSATDFAPLSQLQMISSARIGSCRRHHQRRRRHQLTVVARETGTETKSKPEIPGTPSGGPFCVLVNEPMFAATRRICYRRRQTSAGRL